MSGVDRSPPGRQTRSALGLALASLGVASLLLGGGCAILPGGAGAGGHVVADGARYPISLSRSTRDRDGSIIGPERQERVASFETEGRFWATLYSLVPLVRTLEISDAVNEQVDRVHGDGIVNLRVTVSPHALNWFIPLTSLPVWPGAADVRVTGDVIRVLPRPKRVAREATAQVTATGRTEVADPDAVGVVERILSAEGGLIVRLSPGAKADPGRLLEVTRARQRVAWLRAGKVHGKTTALAASPAYSEPLTAYQVGDVVRLGQPTATATATSTAKAVATGDVGTIERIDGDEKRVRVRLSAGARPEAGELLEVTRSWKRVAWLRAGEVHEKDAAMVASPAYLEPVASLRVGDKVRLARR